MISAAASISIERLLETSVRDHAGAHGRAQGQVLWVGADRSGRKKHAVALSLSTYLFRMVLFFGFDDDPGTLHGLGAISPGTKGPLTGQQLPDVISEMANVICGEINRGMAQRFPHAALSTPIVLEGSCADYTDLLAPTRVWRADVVVGGKALYALTACLCVDRGTELDFDLTPVDQDATATGELELF